MNHYTNIKSKHFKKLTIPFFLVFTLLITGCSKDIKNEVPGIDSDASISFNITGIQLAPQIEKTASKDAAAVRNSSLNMNDRILSQEIIETANGQIAVTLEQMPSAEVSFLENGRKVSAEFTKQASNNPTSDKITIPQPKNLGNQYAATPLTPGHKYRIILWEAGTNNIYKQEVATAGAGGSFQIDIPVDKGKSYDWTVISNNDDIDPAPITSGNPVIETGNKDLLIANSSAAIAIPGTAGDGTPYNVKVPITLDHVLSRIIVEVDAQHFPGDITAINASLGSQDYFKKGSINIKTKAITNPTSLAVPAGITFTPSGNVPTKTANYYTVGGQAINGLQLNIAALSILSGTTTFNLPSSRQFTFNNITPVAGTTYKVRVQFLNIGECNCINAIPSGNYIVEQTLSNTENIITAQINVTRPGRFRFTTDDANGMKFTSGVVSFETTGTKTVTLRPIKSGTVLIKDDGLTKNGTTVADSLMSKPNTAEDKYIWQKITRTLQSTANQGGWTMENTNNQTTDLKIYNELAGMTTAIPNCTASIDVKAKVSTTTLDTKVTLRTTALIFSAYRWLSPTYDLTKSYYAAVDLPQAIRDLIPKDKRVQMDLAHSGDLQSPASYFDGFFYTFIRNISGSNYNVWLNATGSCDAQVDIALGTLDNAHYMRYNDVVNNTALYGSLDPYLNASDLSPTNHPVPGPGNATGIWSAGRGAHGNGAGLAEVSKAGITIRLNGLLYRYLFIWDSTGSSGTSGGDASTKLYLTLYGIYDENTYGGATPAFNNPSNSPNTNTYPTVVPRNIYSANGNNATPKTPQEEYNP